MRTPYKEELHAIIRALHGLNPAYDWAVENFEKMRRDMPNFDQIYQGKKPKAFLIVEQTKNQVRLELAPQQWEWHSKENYVIIPRLNFFTS